MVVGVALTYASDEKSKNGAVFLKAVTAVMLQSSETALIKRIVNVQILFRISSCRPVVENDDSLGAPMLMMRFKLRRLRWRVDPQWGEG